MRPIPRQEMDDLLETGYRMTEAEKRALTDLQHYPMVAIIGCGVASIAVYLTTLAAVKIGKSYLFFISIFSHGGQNYDSYPLLLKVQRIQALLSLDPFALHIRVWFYFFRIIFEPSIQTVLSCCC